MLGMVEAWAVRRGGSRFKGDGDDGGEKNGTRERFQSYIYLTLLCIWSKVCQTVE